MGWPMGRGERYPPICLAAAVMVLGLSGCYSWNPVPVTAPGPGARVSVLLSSEGMSAMADTLGAGIVEVEGQVLVNQPEVLRLAVRQVTDARGLSHDWRGEVVSLAPGYVQEMSRRRLAAGGTVLAGGIALGGLYAVYQMLGGPGILSGNGGGSGGGAR
jgi:hypothetical protein